MSTTPRPHVVSGDVGALTIILRCAAIPLVVVLAAVSVLVSLKNGGSGNLTAMILVGLGVGLVLAALELRAVLKYRAEAERLRELHGQELGHFLEQSGSDLFMTVLRGLYTQWGAGRTPQAVDSSTLLELMRSRMGRGPRLVAAVGSLLPAIGLIGTCVAINQTLGGVTSVLAQAEGGGPELVRSLGESLRVLPSAFTTTIAGIVAGSLVLRSLAMALQSSTNEIADRYAGIVVTYIVPRLRAEAEGVEEPLLSNRLASQER